MMEFVGTNEECDRAQEIYRVFTTALEYALKRLDSKDYVFAKDKLESMSRVHDASAWISNEGALLDLTIDILTLAHRKELDE